MLIKKDYSTTTITQATTALERKCIELGLRITPTRRIILQCISQAKSYLSIEEIYQLNLATDKSVSMSSICSNVKKLVDLGVIEKRQMKSKNKYYSIAAYKPKDQLIDVESGKVIEFRNKELDKIKAKIIEEYGFDLDECHVEFYSRVGAR